MTDRDDLDDDWETDDDCSDEDDEDGDEEDPTIPCPYCKQSIHEDSPRCPHCGQYISKEDSPASPKPWWIVAGSLLCLYIVYRWLVR